LSPPSNYLRTVQIWTISRYNTSQDGFSYQLLEHLKSFKVIRDPEEPKNVEFVFNFSPNDYLADNSLVLTKKFQNIQAPDPESKVTSSKVSINWKPGKDLTKPVKGAPASFFTWFDFENEVENEEDFDCVDIAEQLADEVYPHAHKIYQGIVDEEEEGDVEEDLEDMGTRYLFMSNLQRRRMRMRTKTKTRMIDPRNA
jgi:hypothetical protein